MDYYEPERRRPTSDNDGAWMVWGALALIGLVILTTMFVMASERVEAGTACVTRTNGKANGVAEPGWEWMTPFVDSLRCYPTTQLSLEYTGGETNADYTDSVISQQSADGVDVNVAALLKFHVEPDNLVMIHNQYGKTMDTVVTKIKPVVREQVRAVVNDTPIADIYPGGLTRITEAVSPPLRETLEQKYGITVDSFTITRIDPDDEYEQAVQQQQQAAEQRDLAVAQQEVETENAEVLRIKKEGEANAEANANRILSESITPELLQMRYYEALETVQWAILSPGEVMPTLPVATPGGGG